MNPTNKPRARHRRAEAWPRWLRRELAADYMGVSPSQFDKWRGKEIPEGIEFGGILYWDRYGLDECVEAVFYPVENANLAVWDKVRA